MFRNSSHSLLMNLTRKAFLCCLVLFINGCIFEQSSKKEPIKTLSHCPDQPKEVLNTDNVKLISLASQPIKESGIVKESKQIGYAFEAKSGQELKYNTKDNICIWVYTPNNQLIEGLTLPATGKYTLQITALQGTTTFDIEMTLNDVNPIQPTPVTPTQTPVSPIASSPPPPAPITRQSTPPPEPRETKPIPSFKPSTVYIAPPVQSSPVTEKSREQKVLDALADRTFYEKHPELRGRKIRSDEYALQADWKQIRNCQAVVDYIFYQRHPELGGRKIIKSETGLAREWVRIKSSVSGCR